MSLYTDMAKQVHPDVSSVPNAKDMMQEVNKWKSNPDMLMNLARKWGLSVDGKTFDEDKFKKAAGSFTEKVYNAVVGAIVTWASRKGNVRGVIIKVRTITRGRLKGATEYSVFDFKDNGIWKVQCFRHTFDIVGMADNDDLKIGLDVQDRIKDNKKAVKNMKQSVADAKFASLGLVKNLNYVKLGNYGVQINYRGGKEWKRLVRTTPKSVYIWESDYHKEINKQRRIPIKHILDFMEEK
jgi:hypothetical protein